MHYPLLEIHTQKIARNAKIILELCRRNGIEPAAVSKGYNAIDAITDAIVEAGFRTVGSSRLPHLQAVRQRGYPVATLMLRLPMPSEIAAVVDCADISLNSEPAVAALLDAEAKRQGKRHALIWMRDLGDLREGIFDARMFVETACRIEREFPHLHLLGVGTNLSCYGSVVPTYENLSELVANAREIERSIGRKLDVISGGGTTSLPLLLSGRMPEGINHLRIGGAIPLRSEFAQLEALSNETLILKAEIVEIGEKPTHPVGVLGVDCFGNVKEYEDRGTRRRALLAAGAFDVGNSDKLLPVDPGVRILGCSSDHMIADIHDSQHAYRLGDTVAFTLLYQAMLFATANPLVRKQVIE